MYCSLTYWQTFQSGLIFILTWKKYDFKTYDHLFDYYLHTQLDFVEIGYPLIKLPKISHSLKYTLYNTILRIARNLLETRENIKIESHSFYHIICERFLWPLWGSSKTQFVNDPQCGHCQGIPRLRMQKLSMKGPVGWPHTLYFSTPGPRQIFDYTHLETRTASGFFDCSLKSSQIAI